MAALGRMAAGITHEVGNPLASISSLVQYLRRKVSNTTVLDSLKTIATHIDRISRTVRQMVDFARPNSAERREESINTLVEHAIKTVQYDPRFRNVALELDLSSYVPRTLLSADQLVAVLVNIILNALDAMPDGGTLRVESRYRHGVITVSIADTGVDMSAEHMKHIFEPFYTTKSVGKGTGLGFWVSYAAVQQHGGSIEVHSTPGQGSVFRVHFPVFARTPQAGTPTARGHGTDSHGGTDFSSR
mgnify:CR=1 FL=1